MNEELRHLLEAVRDGRITDTNRVREILQESREYKEQADKQQMEDDSLIFRAERAFVIGKPYEESVTS